jgi:RNA polymerase sigma-70 factor (ECF subfamily)
MTEFPETPSTLLARVRSPDNREAWEQFVLIYRPAIYRMARRRGMQDADAQDLVQTVLIRVAGAIERWEEEPGTFFA